MSVAPHAGVIDFGTFTPPTDSRDGIQGEVPKPLIGQQNYVLTASGWAVASGGSVNSVTGTAPIVSSGGANPAISIGQASTSTDGYLSSTDWNTFNSKLSTQVYPGAGIPNSTGSAWGTSYGVTGTGSVVLSDSPTFTTKITTQSVTAPTDNLTLSAISSGSINLSTTSSGMNINNGTTITNITLRSGGSGYSSAPTVIISAPDAPDGVQATATCTITSNAVNSTFIITNAGSGYLKQPTISFSGGGGSGASAICSVGSVTTFRSLGNGLNLSVDTTDVVSINSRSGTFWPNAPAGPSFGFTPQSNVTGNPVFGFTSAPLFVWNGIGACLFQTEGNNPHLQGGTGRNQFGVFHQANSVNYVGVKGGASGNPATVNVFADGNSANINLTITPKGTGSVVITNDATINGIRVGKGNNSVADNVAVGTNSLGSANSGIGGNVGVGSSTLFANTTGYSNSAIGNGALSNNTTGVNNMGVGRGALGNNTTGSSNVGIGTFALLNATSSNNVAIGDESARYQADGSTSLTTATNSVYIGASTKGFNNSDNNSIVIGYNAIGLGANTTVIGNSSTTQTKVFGALSAGADLTSTSTTSIATGATVSGATNTINVGTGGVAGSTTTTTIGSTTGTSTTILNGTVRPVSLSASQAVFTDASDNLVSVAVTGTGNVVLSSNLPSGSVVGTTDTQTLTNKRVTPRVSTTASDATPTINTDNTDQFGLTAQAVDITSFTTNLSGTPTDGQKLWIYIVGTAARAITWGASFESSTATLPTTTVSTNRLDVGFVWNAATSKWRCVAVA